MTEAIEENSERLENMHEIHPETQFGKTPNDLPESDNPSLKQVKDAQNIM